MAIHCSETAPLVQSCLDGELTDAEERALCDHVSQCGVCRKRMSREERFRDAIREHLAPPSAPDRFHEQLTHALAEEERAEVRARRHAQLSWALPGAATVAAAVALLVFATDRLAPANDQAPLTHEAASRVIGSSPVVVQENHRDMSRSLNDYLRVPIRPPRFSDDNVELYGWRPSHLHGRQAAELVYRVFRSEGRQYTMRLHLLESSNIDLRSQDRREIGGQTIWVDSPLGMSSVTYQDRQGIGYVFISDMPQHDLVDLVLGSDLAQTHDDDSIRGRTASQGQ